MSVEIKGQGLVLNNINVSDPDFYKKKRKKEKELGVRLTSAEFIEKYYEGPSNKVIASGTSIFDPVLCELAYTWFTNEQDKILDPFAGGTTRGLIATMLNRNYTGIDLSKEQIEINQQIAEVVLENGEPTPNWIIGDSRDLNKLVKDKYDFIFTCPPYGDLEHYSTDPKDLSNMGYEEFDNAYEDIIKKSVAKLKEDRFFAIVIGNYRDKDGYLRDLVGKTVQYAENAGAHYYNDVIIRNQVGSAAVRAARLFNSSRKITRIHQYLLVFVKGDPKKATERLEAINTDFLNDLVNEYLEKREKKNKK